MPGGNIQVFRYLRALGKEGSNHDCPRCAKAFRTEVCFRHGDLRGDGRVTMAIAAERELRYGPNVGRSIRDVRWA
jgi:hypothetical protein